MRAGLVSSESLTDECFTIPVVRTDSDARMVSLRDDRPVWSALGERDLHELQATAALLGGRIEILHELDVRPASASRTQGQRGTVFSLVPSGARAGALYAHLTGRTFVELSDARCLPTAFEDDVLFMPPELVTGETVDHIVAARGPMPGIVSGADLDELLLQTRIRSVTPMTRGTPRPLYVSAEPPASFGRLALGEQLIRIGGIAAERTMREGLGSGAAVLVLATHADGVDASLGPLVLCPSRSWTRSAAPRPPRCVQEDRCFRLGIPLAQMKASGPLVTPESIAARVFVLGVCWGANLSSTTVGRGWTLLPALLANPRIGALVAASGIYLPCRDDLEELTLRMSASGTVGAGLREFVDAQAHRGGDTRFVLFGDPRTPVPAAVGEHLERARAGAPRRASPACHPAQQCSPLTFLATYLDAVRSAAPTTLSERLQLADQRMAELSSSATYGVDRIGALQAALCELQCALGPSLVHNWAPLCDGPRRRLAAGHCAHCGAVTEGHELCSSAGWSRRIWRCANCGVVADCDHAVEPLALGIRGRVAQLSSAEVRAPWYALIVSTNGRAGTSHVVAWPRTTHGAMAAECTLPALPDGPFEVAVIVMSGLHLHAVGVVGYWEAGVHVASASEAPRRCSIAS